MNEHQGTDASQDNYSLGAARGSCSINIILQPLFVSVPLQPLTSLLLYFVLSPLK
jgi:hypothetical protein